MADAPDTSRISVTALHTSYVWYRHGMSHRALTSLRGGVAYHAVRPVMGAARACLGVSDLHTYLLQRHIILDHLMDRAAEEGAEQVLELACGLSPRGTRFLERHPGRGFVYVEADLPGMARRKRDCLARAGLLKEGHRVVEANILARTGDQSLEAIFERHLDPTKKTMVITEGIINYFDLPTVAGLWERIARVLNERAGGVYFTDNMRPPQGLFERTLVHVPKRIVEAMARGRTHLHFPTPLAAIQLLTQCGFSHAETHPPEAYFKTLPIPQCRRKSFIQILEARV